MEEDARVSGSTSGRLRKETHAVEGTGSVTVGCSPYRQIQIWTVLAS